MANPETITNLVAAITNCDTDTWANPGVAEPDCLDAWGNPIPEGKEIITTPTGQKICVQKGSIKTADAEFIEECPVDDFGTTTEEGDVVITLDSCEKINISKFTSNEEKLQEICDSLELLCTKTETTNGGVEELEVCLNTLKDLQTTNNNTLSNVEQCLNQLKLAVATMIANQALQLECLVEVKTSTEMLKCVPKSAATSVTANAWGA